MSAQQKYYTQAVKPSSAITFTKQIKPQGFTSSINNQFTNIRSIQPAVSYKQPIRYSQPNRRLSLETKTPRYYHSGKPNLCNYLEGVQIGNLRHSTEPQGLHQHPVVKKTYQQFQKGTQVFQFKKKTTLPLPSQLPNALVQNSSNQNIQHYISKLNNSERLIQQIQSLIDTTDSTKNNLILQKQNPTMSRQSIQNIILQTQHQQQSSPQQLPEPYPLTLNNVELKNGLQENYLKDSVYQQKGQSSQYFNRVQSAADDYLDYLKIPQQFQSPSQILFSNQIYTKEDTNLRQSYQTNLSNMSSKNNVSMSIMVDGEQMTSYYDLHQRLLKDKDMLSTIYQQSLGTSAYMPLR